MYIHCANKDYNSLNLGLNINPHNKTIDFDVTIHIRDKIYKKYNFKTYKRALNKFDALYNKHFKE